MNRLPIAFVPIVLLALAAAPATSRAPTDEEAATVAVTFLGLSGFGLLCVGSVAVACYFAPSFVAFARRHPNAAPIFLVNLLLGWSFIGYIVALAWSFTAIERRRSRGCSAGNPFA